MHRDKAVWERGNRQKGHLQVRGKALTRNQVSFHLALGVLASELWEINFYGLRHPVYGVLLWQPKVTETEALNCTFFFQTRSCVFISYKMIFKDSHWNENLKLKTSQNSYPASSLKICCWFPVLVNLL